MVGFNLGVFGFNIPRPESITLKPDESVIVYYWSWKKFGYKQKQLRLDKDNNIIVKFL